MSDDVPSGFLPTAPALPVQPQWELERGDRVGRYLILNRLAAGGMGVVYTAYDPELDRKIALKLVKPGLAPQARDRLLREARAMARLSHPNVVTVYDAGTVADQVFVAMEYVPGTNLSGWVLDRRRPWRQVVDLFLRAGRGLEAVHAAGLIHRDFKPDNVLVGADGAVRVADFGLARTPGDSAADESASPAAPEPPAAPSGATMGRPDPPEFERTLTAGLQVAAITEPGSVVGTPVFMSPEQHEGADTDARTDQFSFCVALYWGVYGELPFRARSYDELRVEVASGRVREAPPKRRVPKWLRKVLLRGLAVDPRHRYRSLTALLEALSPSARRARHRLLGAIALLVAVATTAIVLAAVRSGPDLQCKGAERKLGGIWDSHRRRTVRAALFATGKPYAAAAWRTVARVLDNYRSAWTRMHVEACEATRLRGEQSEAMLDRRIGCLARRLQELRAVTEVLAHADAQVVAKATEAVGNLVPLARCDTSELATTRVRPPSSAGLRARVSSLRGRIAHARVLLATGKYKQGLKEAAAATEEARKLRYRPATAEALYLLGNLRLEAGQVEDAVKALAEAGWLAEGVRDDELAARAQAKLVYAVGYRQARFREARVWAGHAAAAVRRLEQPDSVRGLLENSLGTLAFREGKIDQALRHFRRAVEIRRRVLGPEHHLVVLSLANTGVILMRLNRLDEARKLIKQALALRRKALGEDHPLVAHALANLGNALYLQGRPREALERFRRALAIRERALGAQSAATAESRADLGLALWEIGRFAEARRHFERALKTRQRLLGVLHPSTISSMANLGALSVEQGRYAEGVRLLKRALALRERTQGKEHPAIVNSLNNLGEAFRKSGKFKEALALHRRALKIATAKLGKKHPSTALALVGLGEAHLGLREVSAAIEVLERAVAILVGSKSDPASLADARFALARALWGAKGAGKRARHLAALARGGYLRVGGKHRSLARRVARWLRSHP